MGYSDSGGSGIPVVALHAGSGSNAMWEHQAGAFTAAGYRFIAPQRGAGSIASDELEELAQRLGLETFHLLGTAAGGIVAVDYALSHAGRLRSLVVANSIVGAQDVEYLELSRRLRPAPQFEALPAAVRELGPSYRATNAAGAERWSALAHAAPRSSHATRNRISFAALRTIAVPTLLLTGDADLYMPPPVLRMLAAHFARGTSVVIPECGHSAFWEQPAIFNRVVLDFLNSVPST